MRCRFVLGVVVALAIAGQSLGFEVGAVIRKIDVEGRSAVVFANGRERTVKIAADVAVLDEDGKSLAGGLGASQLKEGAVVTLSVERDLGMPAIVSIRLGGKADAPSRPNTPGRESVGKPSVGFKPLTEMTGEDRYKGEDGGLYGGGKNELPDALRAAAEAITSKIKPLDAEGNPAADGTI
ncbi:MAG: hypothetical protein KDA41_22420 [Planctomycetales bacterium]|nr:hypothetical protein [Planctomycetales bacterium]